MPTVTEALTLMEALQIVPPSYEDTTWYKNVNYTQPPLGPLKAMDKLRRKLHKDRLVKANAVSNSSRAPRDSTDAGADC